MPNSHSRRTASRIALLISSGVLFALAAWVAFRVFQPVEVPPMMPSQAPVSFNADKTIETNPLFKKLQVFVQGDYVIGTVGNSYPLGGDPKKKTIKGYDNKSLLSTAQEVVLNGIIVRDIAVSKDGGILGLAYTGTDTGQIHYEIRTFGQKDDRTIGQWNAASQPNVRAVGLTEDSTGKIWLVSERGGVGEIDSGGNPSWLASIQTGLNVQDPLKVSISSDSLDRIWITDGGIVSVGGEKNFSPVDLSAELSADQRAQYETILSQDASQIGLQAVSEPDALLRAALQPKAFFPITDGRMGLTTAFGTFIFPQSQSAKSEWIPTLQFSMIPYAVSDKGDVWGVRFTDHVLSRLTNGSEASFASGPAPSSDLIKPSSFAFIGGTPLVFEEAQKTTNLWTTNGDAWSVKLISTTGTQAVLAPPAKIQVDNEGTIWVLMTDGHLYHITAGADVKSPTTSL